MASRSAAVGFALLLFGALARPQDGHGGAACDKFNRCHDSHGNKRKQCPCGKRLILEEDSLCINCARERDVCRHCGLPKPGAPPRDPLEAAVRSALAANIREHLMYLASDELEGRLAGYPGNDKASEYIAGKIKAWGLKPGNGDSYFQPFQIKGRDTRNVIGVIEGDALKDEFVIVGGHFDHVGMIGQDNPGRSSGRNDDPEDKIWNGADDNGSGTSTLLEIARCFAQAGLKPKRTIVFLWFSGEEYGLLGSKHYCANPIFDLKKTYAMVCMDMVGRNSDKPVTIKGAASADDWKGIIDAAAEGTELNYRIEPRATGSTDYLTFVRNQIPAVDFFSDFHADYHKRSDTPDKIDYAQCVKVARATIRLAKLLADREEKLIFKEPPRK
jgi:hypothetical protein